MKYKICYSQLIGGKHYKTGSIIEFDEGTDRNYISRLVAIKAIEEETKPTKNAKKSDEKIADVKP
ncbi:hypothetical protein [Campylobacter hyointestinalis]|uniref:hypothetical protein n=1 Tax=Campylobacter hyointestinalis TaxID=198 RepID=UPI0007242EA1|nr:hypothetical protein [Campylobacter hyointestinalis]PPB63103.1 hypothetical protein CDQ72_01515 [Campylobacter hyointestinalis subsp. hyointestinalis]PPB65373.1 hypothetical protein CDQ73_01265 [Campylobacter hyointestinalis subsp. hyointestinalis]CUU72144.1 Uncharacterised protein [Campylobacter hyointestinalis subsp. hyointestinalis]